MPNDQVGWVDKGPGSPTLIYDGDCEFCTRWANRLRGLDHRGRMTLMPRQDEQAEEVSGKSEEELAAAVYLVRPDGRVFAGAAACREAIRYVPGGWAIAALGSVPGVMAASERVYQWIARRWGPVG